MEKQTDKELEDEMSKEWNSIGGTQRYWELKAELKGRKEAHQGMIKIEDVEKMIDEYYPTWVDGHGTLKRRSEEFLKLIQNELKQSLKELGEKE